MYLFPVTVAESAVEGKGVFSVGKIPKGAVVWKYVPKHDRSLSQNEYENLNTKEKEYMEKVAYLSLASHQYIFPPENDPALYTNHDAKNHSLSVVMDIAISPEPHFIANREIKPGEELTNNYHEFDASISEKTAPDWLK